MTALETYDYGPLHTYQLVWRSGHVEEVRAHQCLLPMRSPFLEAPLSERLTFHGEVGGHWTLILDVDYGEVASVRRMDIAGSAL